MAVMMMCGPGCGWLISMHRACCTTQTVHSAFHLRAPFHLRTPNVCHAPHSLWSIWKGLCFTALLTNLTWMYPCLPFGMLTHSAWRMHVFLSMHIRCGTLCYAQYTAHACMHFLARCALLVTTHTHPKIQHTRANVILCNWALSVHGGAYASCTVRHKNNTHTHRVISLCPFSLLTGAGVHLTVALLSPALATLCCRSKGQGVCV